MTELEKLALVAKAAQALATACEAIGVKPEDLQEIVIALAYKKMNH